MDERHQDAADRVVEHVAAFDVAQLVADEVIEAVVGERIDHAAAHGDERPLDAAGERVGERVVGYVKLRLGHVHDRAGLLEHAVERVVLLGAAADGVGHVHAVEPAVGAEVVELSEDGWEEGDAFEGLECALVGLGDEGVGRDSIEAFAIGHVKESTAVGRGWLRRGSHEGCPYSFG